MDLTMLGQRIVDPRVLSEELGESDPTPAPDAAHPDMYSGLASYTFGSPRPPSSYGVVSDVSESISPLTPVLSPDRTPRPSVSGHPPPFRNTSSHPSQGPGRPASSHSAISSQSRRLLSTRHSFIVNPSGPGSRTVSGSDSERSEDPTPSTDPIIPAYFSAQQRGRVMPDNASQHTFGPASRTHGVTVASSQDGAIPSSSSVSVATSRSSSRASMRTTEQFSSDDEYEIEIYDRNSSPVTFARDQLADIDEDLDLFYPGPSTVPSSILDKRRGSLPMAIPGAVQSNDAYSNRSREGSILTLRRPSRSLDDASTHRSSHSGEDPAVILPKSEPLSRADWLSVEAQLQAKQQQGTETNLWDGIDKDYIFSKRSEGSIRSFNSRLSFVQGPVGPHRSSSHLSSVVPWEDSFLNHIHVHDRTFDAGRSWWSFQREKADGSSSRRRQQIQHDRAENRGKEIPIPKVQEMWRCGHVGRFKVDRLSVKPQSADASKGTQQRLHVRHIPDPFLSGSTMIGPHSVIHKHSRTVAFSIFRSHGLFSGRQGAGRAAARTHISMRLGIMLAPKKVQEQYTSTKAARHLPTYGLLDSESRSSRDKDRGSRRSHQSVTLRERDSRDKEKRPGQDKDNEDRSKGRTKLSNKGKIKDKSDKKHQLNPTESTESSTATSSAGSVTDNALQQVVTVPAELAPMKIQLSPSVSSSTTFYRGDSASHPDSPTSLSPSIADTAKVPKNELFAVPPYRHHRDHRDSIDSDDRQPPRTTHAEAFSALDPNDIEYLRARATHRANVDSGSTIERLIRRIRGGARNDDHSSSSAQPRAFQPPWLITAGRAQQEHNERVIQDLNAAFRDVGLLHTAPSKPSRSASKRKVDQGVLDQVPDDSLCMLLPLWAGETDVASVHAETSSAVSFRTVPENRQYLLVYYAPFEKPKPRDKKPEKKKFKQSHSSDSGVEDAKNTYLSEFYVSARVVTYDELRLTGVRVPSDGLAINGPEWEAVSYSAAAHNSPLGSHTMYTVVCHCHGRERGFDFVEDGLLQLGLCTKEELTVQSEDAEERESKTVPTPIGRAVVEMIWLGCLALTSFGPT